MAKNFFDNINVPKEVVVEIGNDWVKIIESTYDRVLKVYCKKLLDIKGDVAEEILRIFRHLNLNRQGVVLCLPRHLVTVRTIELPSTDPEEIKGMVNLQIGKQTPYSKEEIIFDHKIVGFREEGYARVLFVVARRNLISGRVETLQKAGIGIKKIAVSSEGFFHWFRMACATEAVPEDAAIIGIDIDSNYTDINFFYRGGLVFTRNILIGVNNFLAERTKWEDKFLSEIVTVRNLYLNEDRGRRFAKVLLCGGAQSIEGLDRLVQIKLEAPVEVINPMQNIRTRGNINIAQYEHFKKFSICSVIGISMRSDELKLDLMPEELNIQRMMDRKRRQITTTGVLVAAIVMMGSLVLGVHIYYKNIYLTQLKQRIGLIEKEANAVEKMRLCIDLVARRLSAKRRTLNVLHEVYGLTPKEIYFTNMNIEENKQVILQGRAFAMSNVFEFVTTLEKSSFFENVKTTYTTTKKEKNQEYAKFEIICMFEK